MSSKRTGRSTASNAGGAGGNVVVASKLRETVRAQDIRMSSDFVEALNEEVHDLVTKAVARAKGNGRGTVRPTDL